MLDFTVLSDLGWRDSLGVSGSSSWALSSYSCLSLSEMRSSKKCTCFDWLDSVGRYFLRFWDFLWLRMTALEFLGRAIISSESSSWAQSKGMIEDLSWLLSSCPSSSSSSTCKLNVLSFCISISSYCSLVKMTLFCNLLCAFFLSLLSFRFWAAIKTSSNLSILSISILF